jgi:hypothetical protein
MGTRKAEYYKAKHAFGVMLDGEQMTVSEGEIVRAGHPLLKGRDEHFAPVTSFGRFDVEQATAAPGEKRKTSTPPRKRAAAKPADEPAAKAAPKK